MGNMERPNIVLTPEVIHGLDWEYSMGLINEHEYDELVQHEIDKQLIKIITWNKK